MTRVAVRVLEGPNLYFPRPAAKLTLDLPELLSCPAARFLALAGDLGVRRSVVGVPDSAARQRALMSLLPPVVRRISREAGITRLGIRVRSGEQPQEVVLACPVRSRGRAHALGTALGEVLDAAIDERLDPGVWTQAAATVRNAPADETLAPITPQVPAVSVTGTNGKTTTTRLIAHLAMTAGLRTGWSSTDGVLVQGEVVVTGDYSGPAGARTVLNTPGVEFAVLETARGGMLFKGLGVATNDVSVVTNVSADHLGMQGVDTLDQLAEVKAIVTKVTSGWVVLNGDDPRVWAMRASAPAPPWCFTLSPDSPALRESQAVRGRGITVLDGDIVTIDEHGELERLINVLDVPITLAGLSQQNIANALAGAAAGLAAGLPRDAVVEGLRTFAPDVAHNPGRMNIYSLREATVVLDMAHNEAGLAALLTVASGLRPPGAELWLGLGTGGDRTDEILVNLGEQAGLVADHVMLVHKEHYLRDRNKDEMMSLMREGLARAGVVPIGLCDDEPSALAGLLEQSRPGDVVALMTHEDRASLHDWLIAEGGREDDAAAIRRKVLTAAGRHELDTAIDQLWTIEDDRLRIERAAELVSAHPQDARLRYEYAGTFDSAGLEHEALGHYDLALQGGLSEPFRHRALLQKASTLRHLGRLEESLAILDALAQERPNSLVVQAFRAFTLHDLDRDAEALREVLRTALAGSTDPDVARYPSSLRRFTDAIQ